MAQHDISASTLAKVAEKAFRNGSLNDNAWRRTPLTEEEVLGSRMVNHPLTQYMFCSPGEGGGRAGAGARRARRALRRRPGLPARRWRSARGDSGRSRSSARRSPSSPPSPTADAARAAFEAAGIGPEEVQVAQLQDTESGRRGDAPRRDRALRRTASRRASSRTARRRSVAGCRSTPTAAASPTASRSAPRACARSTRSCCSSAATPAPGRSRAIRGSASPTFTERRASARARS